MKEKGWYNLVFMFVITAFFTALLSGAYEYTKPMIAANMDVKQMQARLNALDVYVPADADAHEISYIYGQRVKEGGIPGLDVIYVLDEEGKIYAYGFPFEGKGLWGEIEGILALSHDLKTVVGIDFIAHSETPGLGGRIDEPEYKEQFRGIRLLEDGSPIQYRNTSGSGQVDAITGATLTSNAVVDILNQKILEMEQKIGGMD